uniref:Uncharacterized protein n=1 Tax=Sexangularia sp. CB-2014 TaxID=1486929 RepID=A0A7S1V5M6_9EUKA|mmetsp:Transcript_10963/g.34819  ORF Transcript_10963/g.34819 Transcript_10963/m.34819 type:complete len:123 (+) Transcript_10963:369-737(+)
MGSTCQPSRQFGTPTSTSGATVSRPLDTRLIGWLHEARPSPHRRYPELHPLLAKRQREATKFADAVEAQHRALEKERDNAEQCKVWAAASQERAKRYARLEEKRGRAKAERPAAAAASKRRT